MSLEIRQAVQSVCRHSLGLRDELLIDVQGRARPGVAHLSLGILDIGAGQLGQVACEVRRHSQFTKPSPIFRLAGLSVPSNEN